MTTYKTVQMHLRREDNRTVCGRAVPDFTIVEEGASCKHCLRMAAEIKDPTKKKRQLTYKEKKPFCFKCDKCTKPYCDTRDKRVGKYFLRECKICRKIA